MATLDLRKALIDYAVQKRSGGIGKNRFLSDLCVRIRASWRQRHE
jgi:hypothetical protein